MSGLSMRTRITTVVISGAIIAPFALMGGSANAAEADLTDGLPVVGGLGLTDGLLGGGGLPVVGGLTDGLLGGGGLPVVGDVLGGGVGTEALGGVPVVGPVVDGLLGDVLGGDILETVTSIADLEGVLETVTDLVDVPAILKTVTDLVKTVTGALDLGDLLGSLPVKINTPSKGEVAGASKAKSNKSEVRAGALPKTGGNADMTALLLCAGLAVAGTGVTLVTRRRNALLGA